MLARRSITLLDSAGVEASIFCQWTQIKWQVSKATLKAMMVSKGKFLAIFHQNNFSNFPFPVPSYC